MYTEEKEELLRRERYSFADLVSVMRLLRAEGGCPWDREQTHRSIRSCLIEETYEVVEAIDTGDEDLLREELGDLLFQVLFHAQIKTEEGKFTIDDVANDICAKMIHRHPHVFGEVRAETSSEVLRNWEVIKTEEKQRNTLSDKLRAIPPMLPALMRAEKVARKTGDALEGNTDAPIETLCKQAETLKASRLAEDAEGKKRALGELLYTVSSLAHAAGIDAEEALSAATDRRILREAEKESNM